MRASDIVIGEYLEMKEKYDRYGYLKAVGIILANQDHSTNYKFTNREKVPYITVVVEHTAFSRSDRCGLIKRIRPRDLQKEVDPRGKYNKDCWYAKGNEETLYKVVVFNKLLTLHNKTNTCAFCVTEKDFLEQYKERI